MSHAMYMLGAAALPLAAIWYFLHARKRAESNLDRLKRETASALLREQERLERKKVTAREMRRT